MSEGAQGVSELRGRWICPFLDRIDFGIPAWLWNPWLWRLPVWDFPYLRDPCPRKPCLRNSHLRNACFRNSHLRVFSPIHARRPYIIQTPLRLPPMMYFCCFLQKGLLTACFLQPRDPWNISPFRSFQDAWHACNMRPAQMPAERKESQCCVLSCSKIHGLGTFALFSQPSATETLRVIKC